MSNSRKSKKETFTYITKNDELLRIHSLLLKNFRIVLDRAYVNHLLNSKYFAQEGYSAFDEPHTIQGIVDVANGVTTDDWTANLKLLANLDIAMNFDSEESSLFMNLIFSAAKRLSIINPTTDALPGIADELLAGPAVNDFWGTKDAAANEFGDIKDYFESAWGPYEDMYTKELVFDTPVMNSLTVSGPKTLPSKISSYLANNDLLTEFSLFLESKGLRGKITLDWQENRLIKS